MASRGRNKKVSGSIGKKRMMGDGTYKKNSGGKPGSMDKMGGTHSDRWKKSDMYGVCY